MKQALDQGAAEQLEQLAALRRDASHVVGLAEGIEEAAGETLARISDGTFHKHLQDLAHALQTVSGLVEMHCIQAVEQYRNDLLRQIESLELSADFQLLAAAEQTAFRKQLGALPFHAEPTIAGVRRAESALIAATRQLQNIREAVHAAAHPPAPAPAPGQPAPPPPKRLTVRRTLATEEELDALISQLQAQRDALPISLSPTDS